MNEMLAYSACDLRDTEGRKKAYESAIEKTAAWFKTGNHSMEELDYRICDLAEQFPNRDIYNALYSAGINF